MSEDNPEHEPSGPICAGGGRAIAETLEHQFQLRREEVAQALRLEHAATSTWQEILDRARVLAHADVLAEGVMQPTSPGDAKLEMALPLGILPSHLPSDWVSEGLCGAGWLYRRRGALTVIVSAHVENDKKLWLHVSSSRPDRIPNYTEMCEVKRVFVGAERLAISVYAPESEHYNAHTFCLHLWAPIGHSPVPDFRRASGGI